MQRVNEMFFPGKFFYPDLVFSVSFVDRQLQQPLTATYTPPGSHKENMSSLLKQTPVFSLYQDGQTIEKKQDSHQCCKTFLISNCYAGEPYIAYGMHYLF